jgi:hypothetical protein
MVNPKSSFLRQFFYIPVAEGVATVPAYTTDDDCRQIMTPLEPARLGHVGGILQTGASYPFMNSVFATKPFFATQPENALTPGSWEDIQNACCRSS